ncbi:MAG: SH3 domain-containing protein [Hyphomicrobiales bacterium]
MFLRNKIIFASVAVFSMLAGTIAAHAGAAQATTAVNVRSGPGTNFQVLDRLKAQEKVDATECHQRKWCYVKHQGINGWVSIKYLTAVRTSRSHRGRNCKFVFKLDKRGPTFNTECEAPQNLDNFGQGPEENDVQGFRINNRAAATACFYTGINYSGTEACIGASNHKNLRGMNDSFASLRLYNGAAAKLCTGHSFRGKCRTFTKDRANLPKDTNKKASSAMIFAQFQQAVVKPKLPNESKPITKKLGGKAILRASQRFDLDTGKIGRLGADVQYARTSDGRTYLRTVNGAEIALISKRRVGFRGCRAAVYDISTLSQSQMPKGSYLCVKTSEGRIAQVQIGNISNSRIDLNFSTYK